MIHNTVTKTASLFDSPEKWDVYLEISFAKENIKKLWFAKLGNELERRFYDNPVNGWSFDVGGLTWYLSEFGSRSLAIWLEFDYVQISLWAEDKFFDQEKISELLKTKEFAPIRDAFSRLDGLYEGQCQVIERGNYYLESEHDGDFNSDNLAWYAGHKTKDLVDQIEKKVDDLRKSEDLTNLLTEICRQTKREIGG